MEPQPELGTSISIDRGYVNDAIDHLLVLGTLLTLAVWAKLKPDEEEHATVLVLSGAFSRCLRSAGRL
jgi:hypothetical protein